jgi:hypothetical protein
MLTLLRNVRAHRLAQYRGDGVDVAWVFGQVPRAEHHVGAAGIRDVAVELSMRPGDEALAYLHNRPPLVIVEPDRGVVAVPSQEDCVARPVGGNRDRIWSDLDKP